MPLHGWEKDVLLPSNWFFKKIQWKEMGGRERRAFEYCSEDGSLLAGHKGAFLHLLGNSLAYTQDVVACFKLFADKNGGMRVSQEEQEKAAKEAAEKVEMEKEKVEIAARAERSAAEERERVALERAEAAERLAIERAEAAERLAIERE